MAKSERNGASSPKAMQPASSTARSQREPKASTSNGGARSAQDAYDGEDFGKRITGKARELFDDEVSQRAAKGASELGLLADALRGAGSRLEGTFSAPYFDGAADQVERLAQLIKNANSSEMLEAVQRLARQRPLLFLSAVIALGIGAGRFLRSCCTRLPAHVHRESAGGDHPAIEQPSTP